MSQSGRRKKEFVQRGWATVDYCFSSLRWVRAARVTRTESKGRANALTDRRARGALAQTPETCYHEHMTDDTHDAAKNKPLTRAPSASRKLSPWGGYVRACYDAHTLRTLVEALARAGITPDTVARSNVDRRALAAALSSVEDAVEIRPRSRSRDETLRALRALRRRAEGE